MPPWTFSSVMKRHTIQLFWGMVLWSKNDLKSLCSFFTRCNFSGIKMRIWSFSYKSHHLESLQRTVFHKFYDSFKIIMVHFPFIRCGIEAICQMLSAVIFNVLSVLRDPYVLGVYICFRIIPLTISGVVSFQKSFKARISEEKRTKKA